MTRVCARKTKCWSILVTAGLKMTPWWNRPVLRTAILPVVFSCVNNWGKPVCTSLTLSNLKEVVDTCLSFKMWFCNLTSSFSGDVGLGLFRGLGIVLHNVCFDSNNRGKNLHDLRYSTKLLTSQKPDFSGMFNWENIIPLRLHSILGLRLWFIVVNKRSRERRQSKTDPGLGKQVVGVAQKVERD